MLTTVGDRKVYLPEERRRYFRQLCVGDSGGSMMRRKIVRWAWLHGQLTSAEAARLMAAED